jgi:hypothetical protein
MWYVVDALIPATKMVVVWEVALAGYHAVVLPYDLSGPNSTITCPEHPRAVVRVYFATNGFCVGATDAVAMPGGSLNLPPPQAAVRETKLIIANKRNGCSGADSLIFWFSPS